MKKILLIDDEQPTLDMCSLLLGAFGYEVLTAKNAEEGIQLFRQENPPIVLTDIKMPGRDGLTVLEQIKALNTRAQVIVITGHGDKELSGRAFDMGATDYIQKPLSTDTLTSALQRAEKNLDQIDQ